MPESIIRSEKDHNEETMKLNASSTPQPGDKLTEGTPSAAQSPIIWTPGFIIRFTLFLVLGLSGAGLLTEAWVNGSFPGEWTELLYTVIAFACWFGVFLSSYSKGVRLGATLSIVWTAFMGLHFCITMLIPLNQSYSAGAHAAAAVIVATNIALLGSYLCLSIAYTMFQRWDIWFFRIIPIVAGIGILAAYYFAPPQQHSLQGLENSTAAIALGVGFCIWWLRPSCWKIQPGPTFLLGIIPLLQLFFSMGHSYTGGEPIFFTMVVLLLSALAALRILQREQQNTR